jgi:hypothetical protein
MAITALTTWADGEQLGATALNAEFTNVYNNALNAASQSEINAGVSNSVGLTPSSNLIILSTQQASTSGTAITFSSIPSGVRKIHIMFSSVSTSGTSNLMIQIGDSGGVETSSYLGAATTITSATPASANFTTGFGITATTLAAMSIHGVATLTLMNSSTNTWAGTSIVGHSNATTISMGAGAKSLSAELDRVVITTVGGAETFDAGAINISYER